MGRMPENLPGRAGGEHEHYGSVRRQEEADVANVHTARRKFQRDLRAALARALSAPAEKPAPLVLVTAPSGLGKTRICADLLRRRKVVWLSERHEMADELEGFLKAPVGGLPPLVGSGPRVPILERRPTREDTKWCPEFTKRILPWRQMGLGRFEKHLGCEDCPVKPTCEYLAWKPTSSWLFAPHAWLGLRVQDAQLFTGRDIAVIDESPLANVLRATVLRKHEIERLLQAMRGQTNKGHDVAKPAFEKLFLLVLDLLDRPPPSRRRVELRKLFAELGFQFTGEFHAIPAGMREFNQYLDAVRAGKASLPRQVSIAGIEDVDPWSVMRFIRSLANVPTELKIKLHGLADALAADTGPRPTSVLVLPHGHESGAIVAGQFVPPLVPDNIPIVVLDATAETLLYERFFPGRLVRVVRADVDQTARIIQTVDHRYPERTLASPDGKAIGRLMQIVDKYKRENPSHKVGVIIKKGTLDKAPHVKARVLQSVSLGDIGAFWAERGKNTFKDYNALFVIGAPEQDHFELEARARAFMAVYKPTSKEVPFTYELIGKAASAKPIDDAVKVTLARGGDHYLPERGYKRHGPDLVYRAAHGAEYLQAIHRIRPFEGTEKTVFFLSSAWVNLPIRASGGERSGGDEYLKIEYVLEDELLEKDPALALKVVSQLRAWRKQGKQGKITGKDLAREIGVTPPAITKVLKRIRGTRLFQEIEELRRPE